MEQSKTDFIYLLSCFLNGEKPEERDYDFEKIYHLADINDVASSVAFEIKKLNTQPESKTLMYFKKSMAQAISSYEEKTNSYNYISSLLTENGFDYIAIKGIIVRDYYPVREFRTSGDIDFIVREGSLDRIYEILKDADCEISVYKAGVIILKARDSMVEIHDEADVNNGYFDNIFDIAEIDGNRYYLGEYDHLLFVLCHLAKHLSYRGAGIRMLTDIDVMIRHIESFDEEKFFSLCRGAGVEKTARVLLSLSSLWFNTPVSVSYDLSNDNDLVERLSRVLIDGGSFGYEQSAVPVSYVKDNVGSDGKISFISKVKIAANMAFPGKEHLRKSYRYYEKHSILYPVAVANRLIDGTFKRKADTKNALDEIFNNPTGALERQELLEELGISK